MLRVYEAQNLPRYRKKITKVAVSVSGGRKGARYGETGNRISESHGYRQPDRISGRPGEYFRSHRPKDRQMAEEGIIVRAAKGRYNLVDSLKNYILSLKLAVDSNDSDNPDGELNFEEEKALHERVKRHISEMKLQTMKGELHKADDVRHVMTDMLSSFKTRMMNIPAKVAPVLEDRDAGYIKERLTSEVTEALNELKDYNPADFYSDEYVEGEDDEQI